MNLKTFYEKFELFAEAPGAVAKMRELVLELAVQGKLVQQVPSDGTAADLLAKVSSLRAKLIKEKKLRKPRAIKPVADFDLSEIPSSWAWTSLAEITEIGPRNDVSDSTSATFLPMPAIPQKYGEKLAGEVRPWGEMKKGFTHLANGDVALGKITPCFQNGKSAVIEGLENGVGAGTTELHVCRPFAPIVEPYYIWIFLRSPRFILEGIPHMTGSAGQKRVPTGYFACKPFPLPPLAEQRRIVAKVDELMALVDKLEQQQTRRDELAAAYAQSAVSALTGTEFTPKPERMKAPKTELISMIRLRANPDDKEAAPLASLVAASNSEIEAKTLWQRSGLAIEDFYQQLKMEIAAGYIQQPEEARLREIAKH